MAAKKRSGKGRAAQVKAAGEALGLAAPVVAIATTPPAGAAVGLAAKGLGLLSQVTGLRSDLWWKAFLAECARRERMPLAEMRRKLEQRMNSDPAMRDVVVQHAQQVMDAAGEECLPILGMLAGAYHAKGQRPDGFFRSFDGLLMECSDSDLAGIRALVGRFACVEPETKSRTIQLDTRYSSNFDAWEHHVAHIEFEKPGSNVISSILGGDWPAMEDWLRVSELLVKNALAQRESRWQIIVKHDDMKRMQAFLKHAPPPAKTYRYRTRGSSGSFTAELELLPHCFGYGTTHEEALERLRRNLPMFIDDAAAAQLDRV